MDILAGEHVAVDRLMGHGGLFRHAGAGARFLAAAVRTPVQIMKTAAVGGPYGMALLAAYALSGHSQALEEYLDQRVFAGAETTLTRPDDADVRGFQAYLTTFKSGLAAECTAAASLK